MRTAARLRLSAVCTWLYACGATAPSSPPSDGPDSGHVSPPRPVPSGSDAGPAIPDAGEPDAMRSGPGDVTRSDAGPRDVASADIGAEGGRVSLPDGASVEIPEGALSSERRITVRVVDDPASLPDDQALRGHAYAFEPHGQRFAQPVTLFLPFTGASDGLTAVRLDDDDDTSWTIVDGGEARSGHLFELDVTHFSLYAVATVPETSDISDDDDAGAAVTSPCETEHGGCDPLVDCDDDAGEARCGACPSGYTGEGDTGCIDIDECAAGLLATCGGGATDCDNLPGDYSCACDAQHVLSGTHRCELPLLCEPLIAIDDETCYEFKVHGVSSPSDTTAFNVATGESINAFYFDVPWVAGTVASRTGFTLDNAGIVADAWLYDTDSTNTGGTVVPNVTGTTLGENTALLDHWGPGGCALVLPNDVGLHLPDTTRRILLQLHYSNTTGSPQLDASALRVCTVAPGTRANIAGLTMLGTENLNGVTGIAPGAASFSSQCVNDSNGPITLIALTPHAHLYGIHFESVVEHLDGSDVTVLDQPYDFDYQVRFGAGPIEIPAGDTLTTTCHFSNTSAGNVAYGPRLQQEMCYVFALAYPYQALDDGVPSLLGPTNTCW